jgi:hypothetical protein
MSAGGPAGTPGGVENRIGIVRRRLLAGALPYLYDGLSEVAEHAEAERRPHDGPFTSVVDP